MSIALLREPSPRLEEGIVTYIERAPVDVDLARRQHDAYRAALAAAGWDVRVVDPADDQPDSVFIEDTLVVCEDLAVLTRPGDEVRRGEVPV
jgi:dimethylargininase